MNAQQFKEAAYKMIDYAIDYMNTIEQKREPLPHVEPGYMKKLIPDSAPEKPEGFDAVYNDIERVVVTGTAHWQHPQFASYFPAGNSWPSILGDILSNATGVNGTVWDSCPVVTELEMIVADWIAKMIGLPKFFWTVFSNPESQGGGAIQTSASDAILLAMIAAREDAVKRFRAKEPNVPRAVLLNRMVAYRSSQCHSSVERAGLIGSMRVRALPADILGNVRARTLRSAIEEDIKNKLVPFLYVAVLGSTGICAFDDLVELGPVCQEFEMWLHVDGAYAGSCFACPEMRYLSKGMEYAWSFNTNMNKWMLTNFDLSWLFLRYRQKLTGPMTGYDPTKFEKNPDWPIVQLKYFGTPSTRRFRAIKMYFVLRNYGVTGMQKYHRNHILMSKIFERYVERDERFEVIGPTRVGLCCFRLRGTNDINEKFLEAINTSHRLHMVPSYFHEVYVIRYAPCYQYLSERDVDISWRICDEYATATIHAYMKKGTDVELLQELYDVQQYLDGFHKSHPDAQWDKEEQDAEALLAADKHESIVQSLFSTAKDGSYGDATEEEDKNYDGYLRSHPETLRKSVVRGDVSLTDKVPSMLHMEIIEHTGQENRKSLKQEPQDPPPAEG